MVGGAVLTEEYAKMIHADAYGADAMEAIPIAEQILLINEKKADF